MPFPKPNRWHPATHRRFQIEDCGLAEAEAMVESKTLRERVLDDRPAYFYDQTPPDDDAPPI
jgi:hypothetical protein